MVLNDVPSMNTPTARLLRLHESDNVMTVLNTLQPGEEIEVGNLRIKITQCLPLGHKVAARAISAGEKILKYGVPIGSAVCSISVGEHVHTHNVKSDYLPTFERAQQQQFFRAQS